MSREFHFTIGLPGCGKSHLGNKMMDEESKKHHRQRSFRMLSMDNYMEYRGKTKMERIVEDLKYYIDTVNFIDGFLTNTDQIVDILKKIQPVHIDKVIVHYWEPDIEACLWNDDNRRDVSSETSIRNAVIETPDLKKISDYFETLPGKKVVSVEMVSHKTERKPDWKVFYDKCVRKHCIMDHSGNVTSESWCLGGSWGDCWGGTGTASSENPPETFEYFDRILEEICPDISFLIYKRLWSECVDTNTWGEGDYYGGSTTHSSYSFNIEGLYNVLVEKGLYKNE